MVYGKEPSDVIVVTGAGGVGMAVARRLGAGHKVVLADYSQDALDLAGKTLDDEGYFVTTIKVDISDPEQVTALAKKAATLGPLRTIVHTAGVSAALSEPDQIVKVDVIGTALLIDAFEELVEPGTVMVAVASAAGYMVDLSPEEEKLLATVPTGELATLPVIDPSTMEPTTAYFVAKRANHVRVEAAAVRYGAKGGRLLSISPALIATPMGQAELTGRNREIAEQTIDGTTSKRIGTPSDIAALVDFLVGPHASYINGTDIRIDSGLVATQRYGR